MRPSPILFVLALAVSMPALAQQPVEGAPDAPYANRQLEDHKAEARAAALMESLRCIQCQGQSIADSDAPIAQAMRSEVRTRIAAGEDPEAIRGWLIERYGEWVSYAPTINALTWPLWVVPGLILLIGAGMAWARFGRKKGASE